MNTNKSSKEMMKDAKEAMDLSKLDWIKTDEDKEKAWAAAGLFDAFVGYVAGKGFERIDEYDDIPEEVVEFMEVFEKDELKQHLIDMYEFGMSLLHGNFE